MLRQPYLPGMSDADQLKLIYQARGTAKEVEQDEAKKLPGYIEYEKVLEPDQKFIFSASSPESLDLIPGDDTLKPVRAQRSNWRPKSRAEVR